MLTRTTMHTYKIEEKLPWLDKKISLKIKAEYLAVVNLKMIVNWQHVIGFIIGLVFVADITYALIARALFSCNAHRPIMGLQSKAKSHNYNKQLTNLKHSVFTEKF